jgi:hypothetical protein
MAKWKSEDMMIKGALEEEDKMMIKEEEGAHLEESFIEGQDLLHRSSDKE